MRFYLEPDSTLIERIEDLWGEFPSPWRLFGADDAGRGGMILDTERIEHAPAIERFVSERAEQWNPDRHPEIDLPEHDLDSVGGLMDGAERDGHLLTEAERWPLEEHRRQQERAEARESGLTWDGAAQCYVPGLPEIDTEQEAEHGLDEDELEIGAF